MSVAGREGQLAPAGLAQAGGEHWIAVTFRAFRKDRFAVVAGIVLLVIVGAAIAAPIVAPFDPYEAETSLRIQGYGTEGRLLGVDGQGRDVLSRVIWGGRVSIPLAVIPVALAMAISMALALVAGYFGGLVGNILMRLVDVLFAFPTVVLAIVVAILLGNSYRSLVLVVVAVLVAPITRVAYIAVREQLGLDFVDAARATGATPLRLMLMHIAPGAFPSVLVYASTLIGLMIIFVAGLGFLGLGLNPPIPDWGLMTAEGRTLIGLAPHIATVPGIAIGITALCFNLVGDGLRFALDPRTRNIG